MSKVTSWANPAYFQAVVIPTAPVVDVATHLERIEKSLRELDGLSRDRRVNTKFNYLAALVSLNKLNQLAEDAVKEDAVLVPRKLLEKLRLDINMDKEGREMLDALDLILGETYGQQLPNSV